MTVQIKLELDDEMGAYVHTKIGVGGPYASIQEYIEALIGEDVERRRCEFDAVKTELERAFAAPEDSYLKLTAQDVIDRNREKAARAA